MSSTAGHNEGGLLDRVLQWTPRRSKAGSIFVALLIVGTLAAIGLTYAALTGSAPFAKSRAAIYGLFLANFAIFLALVALLAWQLVKLFITRRAGFAGVKLHTRLVGLFALIAAAPAIIVALFSGVFLFLGIESWFSERQRTVLENAELVANAYLEEHKQVIRTDVVNMGRDVDRFIDRAGPLLRFDPDGLRSTLFLQSVLRNLSGAYVVGSDGQIIGRNRVELSADVKFRPPLGEFIASANLGRAVAETDIEDNLVFGLVQLTGWPDAFLYIVRPVDPLVLSHLAQTTTARSEYEKAEHNRTLIQLYFFVTYLIIALVVLLAAVWLGVWAANRIVQPIGRLIGASERVSEGDLSVRIDVGPGDDEIGSLGRAFNRMTAQLETQRGELIEANRQLDRRRRFTEAVMSGISAGVLALDSRGRITLFNRSAMTLLHAERDEIVGERIEEAVPELAPLVNTALLTGESAGQITVNRSGATRTLTARVSREPSVEESRSIVITFDDITDLVSAQRMSAWADIARRIAHEIKNPLTPIQLSAERLRRKYGATVNDPEIFEQCTDTIVRQVTDIGRMVDEFSSFARMPQAVMASEQVNEILREATFLQRVANPDITFELIGDDQSIALICDRRLLTQALTNIIKNATEAIAARREQANDPDYKGHIRLQLIETPDCVCIEVEDNGCGLPREQRHRLAEPYVTTRAKGTGLGLAIVKKIMEDHRGILLLQDATADGRTPIDASGAVVTLKFYKKAFEDNERDGDEVEKPLEGVAHGA